MKGLVKLVGISNFVRLEDGAQETRLVIELPNGKQISSFVSDEDLASVVEAFAPGEQKTQPAPDPRTLEAAARMVQEARAKVAQHNPALFQEEMLPTGEMAVVFGGVDPGEAEDPPVQELAPVVPITLPKRKSRLVGKDEAGNPVVEVEGEDPALITGTSGDKDEDGVAQL